MIRLRIFSAVLFPAPLWPMMPNASPSLYLKREILQGPEFPLVRLTEFLLPKHSSGQSGYQVAQGVVDLALAELLVNMLHPERDVRHSDSPVKCFPRRLAPDA